MAAAKKPARKPAAKKPRAKPVAKTPDAAPASPAKGRAFAATCKTCPHFAARIGKPGLCRRFPKPIMKGQDEWCGEHPLRQVPPLHAVEIGQVPETSSVVFQLKPVAETAS